MINEFINQYGMTILYTLITAFAGYIGLWLKGIFEKYINDKTKREVVKTCVQAVQQLYKNLDGEEKYNEVVSSVSEMLAEKGISITELEIKMLIEAAVGEFKDNFKKDNALATSTDSQTFANLEAGDNAPASDPATA